MIGQEWSIYACDGFEFTKAPLCETQVPKPAPGPGQVLVRVAACAVCRTDLHVVDGELPNPKLPLVPGHEIVGYVEQVGAEVERFKPGDRVGIPWLGWTCGECNFCRKKRENLCDLPKFTGYTLDGGYADYTLADARFCFPIPDGYSDAEAAPLLTVRYEKLAMRSALVFTVSARLRISSHRWLDMKVELFLPLPGRVTSRRSSLPNLWARFGQAIPTQCRQKNLMPPSSSRLLAAESSDKGRHRRLRRNSHERHSLVPI